MRIRKIAQSIGVIGKILNARSTSTTDTYSCNYVNELQTYSTAEQVIGTWVGKPLYRKIVSFLISSTINQWINVNHNVSNVESIFIKDFIYEYNNASYNAPNDIFIEIAADRTVVKYYNKDAPILSGNNAFAIIEYTKTTD